MVLLSVRILSIETGERLDSGLTEDAMENPKDVVKHEPRKSLIILCLAGVFSIVVGIVVLIGLGSGESQMGGGAGWVMIACGVLCIGFYVYGRKTRKK